MIKTEGSRALSQWNRGYPLLTCHKGPNFEVLLIFLVIVWRRCQWKRSIKRKVSPFLYILWTRSLYFKSSVKNSNHSFQWNLLSFTLQTRYFRKKSWPMCKILPQQSVRELQLSTISLPVGGLMHEEDQWKTRVSLRTIVLIGRRG